MSPYPKIEIIAYIAINDIQRVSDNDKQMCRYERSFRYEHNDPLQSRRMAFNKLFDEKQSRMFGYDGDPAQQFKGLSLVVEYKVPSDDGNDEVGVVKQSQLLTGEPMGSELHLELWQSELSLLKLAHPDRFFPSMPVEGETGKVYEILKTDYWISMFYFYER